MLIIPSAIRLTDPISESLVHELGTPLGPHSMGPSLQAMYLLIISTRYLRQRRLCISTIRDTPSN